MEILENLMLKSTPDKTHESCPGAKPVAQIWRGEYLRARNITTVRATAELHSLHHTVGNKC